MSITLKPFVGGTVTLSDTDPVQILAGSSPVHQLWVGAKADNSADILLGDETSQNMPVQSSNPRGFVIKFEDLLDINTFYVKGESGDVLYWRAWR